MEIKDVNLLPISPNTRLFSTVTGSHIWKMNHAQSDIDLSTAYIMSSKSFLRGISPNNHVTKMSDWEETRYEIGNVITHLKKSNVNYIWMVMSPIIHSKNGRWLDKLRQIVVENPSKKIYYSIRGLARNNMRDFIEKGDKDSLIYRKKLNTIGRTVQFGINFLLYERYIYETVNIKSKEELENLMIKLNNSFDSSQLSSNPDQEPFDNYLEKIRLHFIEEVYTVE